MRTFPVSQFKARCLGLLKEVRDGGEPLVVTLRGQTLAVVQAQGPPQNAHVETVAETLDRLHPLLLVEPDECEGPVRTSRPSATEPLAGD